METPAALACVDSHLQRARARTRSPGAGMDKEAVKPFAETFKDSYLPSGCFHDGMLDYADKHTQPGGVAYNAPNVSIVRYDTFVPKEDREAMSPQVCFGF